MPTDEENAFMADPRAFMRGNMLRVDCGKPLAGNYNFSLIRNDDIPSRKKNRNGRRIDYYELTQRDDGDIAMWFLPYQQDTFREFTLPIDGPDLMVTAQLNGCTFGHSQSHGNAGCYVTHHNALGQDNDPNVIEGQDINNPFDDPFVYFHQNQYRKMHGGEVDTRYFATIVGQRDGHDHWHFYAQKKKRWHFGGFDPSHWTLKGVVNVNP